MAGLFNQSENRNNLIFAGLLLLLILCFLILPYLFFFVLFFGSLGYAVYSQNRLKSVLLTICMLLLFYSYIVVLGTSERSEIWMFAENLISVSPFVIPFCLAVFFAADGNSDGRKKVFNYLFTAGMIAFIGIVFLSGIN
ncbi:hypothetical protein MmiEs2_12400 [Methanimicrococcus stummii]|uniref:Uncharacterized protein n=1 Tax=Methanimicrococcus stummii TaxID=3028294 RepID=A0AA96VIM3_9EURY|nr:hypothetical protein MmiEs2_12400 [Methanimicrococcus sp. Es2]